MGSFEQGLGYFGNPGDRDDTSPVTRAYRALVAAEAARTEAVLDDLLARRDRLRAALAARLAASTTGTRDRGDEQPEAGVVVEVEFNPPRLTARTAAGTRSHDLLIAVLHATLDAPDALPAPPLAAVDPAEVRARVVLGWAQARAAQGAIPEQHPHAPIPRADLADLLDRDPPARVTTAPPPPAAGLITPALVAAVLADLGPRDAAALHAWAEQPPAKQAAIARDWAAALETRRRAGGPPDPPV